MVKTSENIQTPAITNLPDGPKTPRLLQTIRGILHPIKYIEKSAQEYGDFYTAKFAAFPTQVIISNPQAIQEIFTADSKVFNCSKSNQVLHPLLGEYSLILQEGNYHQQQRKLLLPSFHGERMKAYGETICEITKQVINQWEVGQVFPARQAMQEISLKVILRTIFGLDEGERYQQLRELMGILIDTIGSPLKSSFILLPLLQKDLGAWSPWGKFIRQKQQIDKLLSAEIQERKAKNDFTGEDILTLMMTARDEAGQAMTEAELRDELMTLLFAGHETTATALAWALYWIHYLPEVKEKLLNELNTMGENPDLMAITKLPYLNAVCCETLRIYPVVLFTFARLVQSPIKIMDYEFQPGTLLSPCIYLVHHREDLYPQPKQFKPERFLERQFSPYEFLPFGGGNRRCIGMAFAMFEMKLVLATILRHTQLNLAEKGPILPVRRGVTMTPAGGVKMIATKLGK
jgi:cytochrome P450